MDTAQRRIGSGFGGESTAEEVLHGIDLSGCLALVTGGYSGIGLATVRALAGAGARVVVPARRPDAARDALAGLAGVEVDALDLADLGSVRAFAERFLATGRTLDIVIANAALLPCPPTRVGPGWEAQFAVDHLGHFALVNLLWPAVEAGGARVVTVSSGAHHHTGVRWDDVDFRTGYDKWLAYAQAKTANALFAAHLDTLARDRGVRAFSANPGVVLSSLQNSPLRDELVERGWIDADGNATGPGFKSCEQGAATQVWAATSPRLAGLGGLYCEDCDIAEPAAPTPGATPTGVRPHAADPTEAARLWTLSAARTGINAFPTDH
ncbi:SDR family NAD(P)-dependent oxidoreductase [Streptomyces capparidis]